MSREGRSIPPKNPQKTGHDLLRRSNTKKIGPRTHSYNTSQTKSDPHRFGYSRPLEFKASYRLAKTSPPGGCEGFFPKIFQKRTSGQNNFPDCPSLANNGQVPGTVLTSVGDLRQAARYTGEKKAIILQACGDDHWRNGAIRLSSDQALPMAIEIAGENLQIRRFLPEEIL